MHWKGRHLRDLSGGPWEGWRSLAIEVAIAIPFWGVWELTACFVHLAVERVHAPTATYQPLTGADQFLLSFQTTGRLGARYV
ncbi:MAG: hypothetical protein WCA91_20895 [Candidatus Acidiferrales bacterium]